MRGTWPSPLAADSLLLSLRPRLEYQVERRLRGAPERGEPCRERDLAQPALPGLRAERRSTAGERVGNAEHRRGGVEHAADRIQVVLDAIMRERLDNHPRSGARKCLADVPGCADR